MASTSRYWFAPTAVRNLISKRSPCVQLCILQRYRKTLVCVRHAAKRHIAAPVMIINLSIQRRAPPGKQHAESFQPFVHRSIDLACCRLRLLPKHAPVKHAPMKEIKDSRTVLRQRGYSRYPGSAISSSARGARLVHTFSKSRSIAFRAAVPQHHRCVGFCSPLQPSVSLSTGVSLLPVAIASAYSIYACGVILRLLGIALIDCRGSKGQRLSCKG